MVLLSTPTRDGFFNLRCSIHRWLSNFCNHRCNFGAGFSGRNFDLVVVVKSVDIRRNTYRINGRAGNAEIRRERGRHLGGIRHQCRVESATCDFTAVAVHGSIQVRIDLHRNVSVAPVMHGGIERWVDLMRNIHPLRRGRVLDLCRMVRGGFIHVRGFHRGHRFEGNFCARDLRRSFERRCRFHLHRGGSAPIRCGRRKVRRCGRKI